jgi:predicted AlkP superfamily pyrophosphatase or phosphodiesterase
MHRFRPFAKTSRFHAVTGAAGLSVFAFAAILWIRPARAEDPEGVRLIVIVTIDQLRGDSLTRYAPLFGPGGLRRISEGGVWYQNAHFTHGHTVTAPGHATIGTGGRPAGHGIAGNEWIDRSTGSRVYCVEDGAQPVVGTAHESGNASPRNLTASTFADEWIFATAGRARAFGVSGKDRGAILAVGKSGKAFWFHTGSGRMVSSRYYYSTLPTWAAAFSNAAPADKYFKKSWERVTRDDDGVPSAKDDRSFERDVHGMGRAFPHVLGGTMEKPEGRFYEQVQSSIFADEIVMDFALELLRAEELGRRGVLDILSVSLSSNDVVGHNFGPDSVEAKEMAAALDRQLARLLAALEEAAGAERYLLVLTSDHGVAYSPEAVRAHDFSAHRFQNSDILRRINRRLNFTIRYLDWSAGFSGPGFYFDPEALVHGGRPAAELEDIVADVIRSTRGVAAAFTRSDILAGKLPDSELGRRVLAAYNPDRSPDVYVVPEPYWLEGTGTASHGTPYSYDSHVPLVFYGAGLGPARVLEPADMMDLAPTLTAFLGCTPPSASQGRPLEAVVRRLEAKRPLRR